LLMLDERRSHVREHRMTVLGFDAEFTAGSSMTHSYGLLQVVASPGEADRMNNTLSSAVLFSGTIPCESPPPLGKGG
jgi:hypothetical protein